MSTLRLRIWKQKENTACRLSKPKDSNFTRDVELIRERWVRWSHTLLTSSYRSPTPGLLKNKPASRKHTAGVQTRIQQSPQTVRLLDRMEFTLSCLGPTSKAISPRDKDCCVQEGELGRVRHLKGYLGSRTRRDILLNIIPRRLGDYCDRVRLLLRERMGSIWTILLLALCL